VLGADAMKIDQRRTHQTPSCDTQPLQPPFISHDRRAATGHTRTPGSLAAGDFPGKGPMRPASFRVLAWLEALLCGRTAWSDRLGESR
jgi:hypothetical protein